jgi:hypothetical protein
VSYEAVQCRFVTVVGWSYGAGVWWGTCTQGHHVARWEIERGEGEREPLWAEEQAQVGGARYETDPVPDETVCERCGAPYLVDAPEQERWGSHSPTYSTASGRIEPGVLYWETYRHEVGGCPWWDNCDGRHLHAVCPNGCDWDVDSRANNCALPADRLHRCWVRAGDPEADPPTVHVSKDGPTCAAGAGSIVCSDYHGFLQLDAGRSVFTAG